MVIGGQANAIWGQPRMTLDINIIIWVEREEFSKTIKLLKKVFKVLAENPEEFLSRTQVIPY